MTEKTFIALSEEQLSSLEERFALILPVDYRKFCHAYPERLTKKYGAALESISELKIIADCSDLLELNTCVRNPDLWYFGEHAWPSKYFVIGHDGCGDHYFLDTSGEHPGVLFQDINSWDIKHIADSMEEFAHKIEYGEA